MTIPRSPMSTVPRQEVPEFQKLLSSIPRGSEFSSMNQKERQAFIKQNRDALAVFGISTVEEMQDKVNSMQRGAFRRYLLDPALGAARTGVNVVTWPVRKILWPPVRWVMNNPIKSTLIAGLLAYFGAPYIFRLWAGIERNNAGVGLNWFRRFAQSMRPLSPRLPTSNTAPSFFNSNINPPGTV